MPTIIIQPDATLGKDAMIEAYTPNGNFWNSFVVGKTASSPNDSLIQFDIPKTLPKGSIVSDAKMTLYVTGTNGYSLTIKAFEITSDWDQKSVTWNTRPTRDTSIVHGTVFIPPSPATGYYSWPIRQLVEDWINGRKVNRGIYLTADPQPVGANDRFSLASSEYATEAYRPKLEITYTLPPDVTPVSYNLGLKTIPLSVLSYNVALNDVRTISKIVEKLNGVPINTETNPTLLSERTVNISNSDWEGLPYGNAHISVEITDSTGFVTNNTYPFIKGLIENASMLEITKGVQGLEPFLYGVKADIASAIRGKGGTVNDADSFEVMASVLSSLTTKKFVTGTLTSALATKTRVDYDGFSNLVPCIDFDFSMLDFVPSRIEFLPVNNIDILHVGAIWHKDNYLYASPSRYANSYLPNNSFKYAYRVPYVNGVVSIPIYYSNTTYTFYAYE